MNKNKLLIIAGPTASGKSTLALKIASRANCPILSADSRQIYKGMNIGTAKATEGEQKLVKHYLLDLLQPGERYSAAQFETDALAILDRVFREGERAILCGGTGFYIDAVIRGLDPLPRIPEEINIQIEEELKEKGVEALYKELKKLDPKRAEQIDSKNPRRVIRSLAIVRYSGEPFNSFLRNEPIQRPWQSIRLMLLPERDFLYERINKRVDWMIQQGLEKEARELYNKGLLEGVDTVGYSEWVDYFEQKINWEECVYQIKKNTRRYAKRQYTWFRRQQEWEVFDPNELEKIIAFVEEQFLLEAR
ncbi:MAG: tRNA (adenosine(37)-N6)-dimethylallyltransferase MiaA [Saprospirales bacterium]|nr:MAG: tRNA (adenosine(37)-N6)-dimethylallyltransferase MiaA [Saprospirales bacterium]